MGYKIDYKEGSKAANLKFLMWKCGTDAYSLFNSTVIYKSRTLSFRSYIQDSAEDRNVNNFAKFRV
jgi:hypothetical protein